MCFLVQVILFQEQETKTGLALDDSTDTKTRRCQSMRNVRVSFGVCEKKSLFEQADINWMKYATKQNNS